MDGQVGYFYGPPELEGHGEERETSAQLSKLTNRKDSSSRFVQLAHGGSSPLKGSTSRRFLSDFAVYYKNNAPMPPPPMPPPPPPPPPHSGVICPQFGICRVPAASFGMQLAWALVGITSLSCLILFSFFWRRRMERDVATREEEEARQEEQRRQQYYARQVGLAGSVAGSGGPLPSNVAGTHHSGVFSDPKVIMAAVILPDGQAAIAVACEDDQSSFRPQDSPAAPSVAPVAAADARSGTPGAPAAAASQTPALSSATAAAHHGHSLE